MRRKQVKSPKVPGARWRMQAGGDTRDVATVAVSSEQFGGRVVFDELVIDEWLHLEQMNREHWWLRVGDVTLNVTVGRDGKATVLVERDR